MAAPDTKFYQLNGVSKQQRLARLWNLAWEEIDLRQESAVREDRKT
jgi:hypothetical protein